MSDVVVNPGDVVLDPEEFMDRLGKSNKWTGVVKKSSAVIKFKDGSKYVNAAFIEENKDKEMYIGKSPQIRNQLDACAPCAQAACEPNYNKKDKNMGYANVASVDVRVQPSNETATVETKQKNHLLSRLNETARKKQKEARKTFHLDSQFPKTWGELKAKLKAGEFTINWNGNGDEPKDSMQVDNWILASLDFRKEPADPEGFEDWLVRLDAARQRAHDEIVVFSAEKGLEVLREFEDTEIK